jgi:primary-amine oxidase
LVICASSEVGNYDYGMAWVFHQDGSLDLDMTLTGVMLPKGVTAQSMGEGQGAGHLVAQGLVAPHHQHFMNFRLDFDIDGTANTAVEMNVAPAPGEANPLGNRMEMSERTLESELQARRDLDFASARRWKIINPAVKNDLGYPSGYILVPGDNSVPYLTQQARASRGADFLSHHLWVSRFKQDEMHASGEFPGSGGTGDGLARWTSDDEPLTQTDLVLWYTLGVTHLPRPEEWPVMSVTHAGFRLVPAGFFSRNPSLDVPP